MLISFFSLLLGPALVGASPANRPTTLAPEEHGFGQSDTPAYVKGGSCNDFCSSEAYAKARKKCKNTLCQGCSDCETYAVPANMPALLPSPAPVVVRSPQPTPEMVSYRAPYSDVSDGGPHAVVPVSTSSASQINKTKAAAKLYCKTPSKAHLEPFAELMRTTPELQPRLLLSQGCGGSSALVDQISKQLALQGLETKRVVARGTCLPGASNLEAHEAQLKPPSKASVEVCKTANQDSPTAMAVAAACMAAEGQAAVLKGRPAQDELNSMSQLGAKMVVAFRTNVLARLICMSRDCFTVTKKLEEFSPNNEKEDGYEHPGKGVATNVGPNPKACFARRNFPSEKQTQVHLDVDMLMPELERLYRQGDEMQAAVMKAGYTEEQVAVVTTEALYASESDPSDAALQRTVNAWKATLVSLGIASPDPAKIQEMLSADRNSYQAHASADVLSNAEEVKAILAEAGEPFASMPDLG